jgi:hypothetical protein
MERLQSNNLRREIKFQIPNHLENEVRLRLAAEGWLNHYPDRIVNSIYYDTENDKMLFDSIYGIAEREKMRLRWYNSDITDARFEIKTKKGESSNKEVILLNEQEFNFDIKNMLLPSSLHSVLPNKNIKNCSIVKYNRVYLYNKINKTRITFDKNISTLDFITNKERELTNSFILELKCHLDFSFNLNLIDFQTRFSKYAFSRVGTDVYF